jgi:hypothetical protein
MRAMSLLLLLTACQADLSDGADAFPRAASGDSSPPGHAVVEVAQLPPPIASSLRAPDLVRGRTAVFQVRGSLPGGRVYFARGGTVAPGGLGACLPALGGACLDIRNPALLGSAVADSWGTATLNLPIPPAAPLISTNLQAAAINGADPYLSDVEGRAIYDLGHDYPIGNHDPLDLPSNHARNYILGTAVDVPDDVTVRGFGVQMRAVGPRGRFALYTNVGGAPGSLVAQTTDVTPASLGGNEFAATAPVAIPRGRYWLMGVWETDASLGYTESTDAVVQYTAHTLGTALPTSFPAPSTYTGQDFNYWLIVD